MSRFINLIDKRFERLLVISNEGVRKGHQYWLCQCDCGNKKIVEGGNLKSGNTKSCGCFHVEQAINKNKTHGMRYSKEYTAWESMITRCHNTKNKSYADHGGKGISVCDEWRESFQYFINHIGKAPSPNHSVDRINNNGDYEPGNVRWATRIEQANNKSNNRYITYNGKTLTLAQWESELNLRSGLLSQRIRQGFTEEMALTKKVRNTVRNKINQYIEEK